MLTSTLLAMLVLQAAPLAGEPCEGETQQAMTQCARDRASEAEALMEMRFAEALASSRDTDRLMREDGYQGISQPIILERSQEEWLRYREDQCAVEGLNYVGGSMRPMVEENCWARLARMRAAELAEALGDSE